MVDHLLNVKGRNEAPKILTDNQYPCDLADALQGPKPMTEIDGKKQSLQIYEIACQNKRGAILRVNSQGKIVDAIDCYQADFERKANKAAPGCQLPLNKHAHKWLDVWIKPLFPTCDVHGVSYIGRAPSKVDIVYEVACKGGLSGGSGFYTLPPPGTTSEQTKPLAYQSCLRAASGSVKCTRTDEKGTINNFKLLADKGSKGCVPSNARFMGGSKDKLYYEILCASNVNFVLVTDDFDQFGSAINCKDAEPYGAKCQYGGIAAANLSTVTDKATNNTAKARLATTNAALQKAGKICTALEVRVIGNDAPTGRDLVEIKCQENPYGLVGYLPTAASTSKADLTDCFTAFLRKLECRFFPVTLQKKRVEDLVAESTAFKADCVVSEIRYVGATADQDLTVEIACENKRGYMAVITPDRRQIAKALPCRLAANRPDWEKCAIVGNGSYTG
ncbi:hypothetical protein AEYBE204_10030 [Asticcacaulis sp. YBE204]|nr:hypothetical protein AEYBE204_10030 [Asticcacaulis sp. YBE204]